MTAPLSLDDEIRQHVEVFGGTEEEAAVAVVARRARKIELLQTTDPTVLHPAIRDALKLTAKIERVVKTVSSPAHYRIETDAGTVQLGPSTRWAARPSEFSAAFLDIGEMPTLPKPPARNDLCTMIVRAAEPEDVGEEATSEGWMRVALSDYLAARPPVHSLAEVGDSFYPFVGHDGRVVIFAPAFRTWLLHDRQERMSASESGRRLRALLCEPDKINIELANGRRTTRAVWRLAHGVPQERPI
jgi:hypothetical protein